MKWLKKNAGWLSSVALMLMTLTIFGPLELYFTNGSELWFGFDDALKITLILTALLGTVLIVVGLLLKGKAKRFYGAAIFILSVALYIQGNYANINYGTLDGDAIDWGAYLGYGIADTIGWIVFIAAAGIFAWKKPKLMLKVQKFGSLFIIVMMILSLGIIGMTSDVMAEEKSDYYLSEQGMYEISAGDNIIIFVLDAFDDAYYQDIFDDDPEKYSEIFQDFTYFNNASVCAARTKAALPAIITGSAYPGQISYSEYIADAFDSDDLYTKLNELGYDVGIYTESIFVPDNAGELIDNQMSSGYAVSSYGGLAKKYFELTLYKYVPHVLKQFFWLYTGDFDQYQTGADTPSYVTDDAKFYQGMKLTASAEGNVFRLYHLHGAHSPYRLNEKAQNVDGGTDLVTNAKGALHIVDSYIDQMKQLGVYDDSTIIIMADHGEDNAIYGNDHSAHGILFVKEKNASKDYTVSAAPVSYFDLHATLLHTLGFTNDETFFDIEEGDRSRLYYLLGTENSKEVYTEYRVDGNLNDAGTIAATGNKFSPDVKDIVYSIGTQLSFGLNATASPYCISGVSATDPGDYAWSTGKSSVFRFPLKSLPSENLMVTVNCVNVYTGNGPQEVLAYANDVLCGRFILDRVTPIQFVIPGDLIGEDKVLDLRLEYPNAVSPESLFGEGFDARVLALALSGLRIDETSEKPSADPAQLYSDFALNQTLVFTKDNEWADDYLIYGFSKLESTHTWNNGKYAMIGCILPEEVTEELTCVVGLSAVYGEKQRVVVSSNYTQLASLELGSGDREITFTIPGECVKENGELSIQFSFPDAVSPKEQGTGSDARVLAMAIKSITLYDAAGLENADSTVIFVPAATPGEQPGDSGSYKLGTGLTFGVNGTALSFATGGISVTDEKTFCWTDGDQASFEFALAAAPESDLKVSLNVMTIFDGAGAQRIKVYSGSELCHEETLKSGKVVEFTVPADSLDGNVLTLTIELPDAAVPAEVTNSADYRTLALAIQGLTIDLKGDTSMNITDIVSIPLGYLLGWCYDLLNSYGLAIILFTFLTKVILFPVSMWVQKNGIAMVKLTPELNRLKIKYYGDKDTIADETQLLYKRENYHPLTSTIPMIIQLVMLMGVIGAVKNIMGGANTLLTAIPSEAGGWTYLMPLAAGVAALALGLAQNKLNPLQREQSSKEQWMTNGFSIAISLFLGAFVSLGVGIYWICSNLFSILQQLLLNVVIKPEKYIDYADLEASKKELAGIENLGTGVSKEDKKREKADYKRFFSVANKHLVFYSEKSGFYKYFKDVIDYLLEKSNVIIHYVTSDPKDQIFTIAETQPRIKPYYIGENKLITLMMKMDADIVVMTCPDLDRFHLKRSYVRKDIEYIYMFHYPLSTHMVLNTGALDHYDTIFCVGEFQFDEIRAAERVYNLPEKKLIAAGYGQLEQLDRSYQAMEKVTRKNPKILIAPSWQPDNILDSCIDPMLEQLLDKGYEVVVRPHPEYVKRYKPRMDKIVERYADREASGLKFELDFTSNNSVFDSDILITDWSGTAYEFSFVTLKPSVFIDTKPKINNPEYVKLGIEPLEFGLRSQVGIQVAPDKLEGLDTKINELLANGEQYADKILGIRNKYIANFGTSGVVGGKYILRALKDRKNKS